MIKNFTLINAQGTSQSLTVPAGTTYEAALSLYSIDFSNVDVDISDSEGDAASIDDEVDNDARVTLTSRKVKSGL